MSPTPSDTVPERRPVAQDLSTPHLRAVRKQLLIVRASIEREELGQATTELRQTMTHFSWIKFLVPGFAGVRGNATKHSSAGLGAVLKQYPLLSSIASLLLAKPLRTTLLASAKPLLKWGGLGLAAWEAYRVWQQVRRDSDKPVQH
ncbi:DUF3318 domain-containing protein [Paraburkholderia hayleyella]|uniref:DUF3318 domain-containing protein n=1 Tax=Paraburkholderia hayleyella TaxID=2152889 RepID=UPI0012926288|nr:DUF3318 domain-containing protein [Paraburkholderia hayleyella]